MEAVVHIGMMKTGTSSIQRWLRLNREALLERGLFYDPLSLPGYPATASHADLTLAVLSSIGKRGKGPLTQRRQKLDDLASQRKHVESWRALFEKALSEAGSRKVVLSSEGLSATLKSPAEVRALSDWLAPYFSKVTYVGYLRRQPEWLASFYSQSLRIGRALTLAEFVSAKAEVDYHAFAQRWAEGVGHENLALRIYRDAPGARWNVVEDFAAFLGVGTDGLKEAPRVNSALDIPGAEFLRRINERLSSGDEDEGRPSRMKGVASWLTKNARSDRKIRLTKQQTDDILAINADGNERLRADFFADQPELFAARDLAPGDDPTPASDAELVALGLDLVIAAEAGELSARPRAGTREKGRARAGEPKRARGERAAARKAGKRA